MDDIIVGRSHNELIEMTTHEEVLKLATRGEEFAEVRGVWNFQHRLSEISTDVGVLKNSGYQTATESQSIGNIIGTLKDLGAKHKEQSRIIETDLLTICEDQIEFILNQVAEEGNFNEEQQITTKSCFFPGKEIEFFHDPNEIFINATLTIPLIRTPGYEESLPESADMPLEDDYYEDESNKASGDEDGDGKSGSGTVEQIPTWWSSSALRILNEDRRRLSEPRAT
ncbi:MAG: hypothetical protein Q9212_003703 [Teloschistes hypoglaucus]